MQISQKFSNILRCSRLYRGCCWRFTFPGMSKHAWHRRWRHYSSSKLWHTKITSTKSPSFCRTAPSAPQTSTIHIFITSSSPQGGDSMCFGGQISKFRKNMFVQIHGATFRYPSCGRTCLSKYMALHSAIQVAEEHVFFQIHDAKFDINVNLRLPIYRCNKHLKFHKISLNFVWLAHIWFDFWYADSRKTCQQTKLALQKHPTIYYRNKLHTEKEKLSHDKAQRPTVGMSLGFDPYSDIRHTSTAESSALFSGRTYSQVISLVLISVEAERTPRLLNVGKKE